jgi:hypothetical protein
MGLTPVERPPLPDQSTQKLFRFDMSCAPAGGGALYS